MDCNSNQYSLIWTWCCWFFRVIGGRFILDHWYQNCSCSCLFHYYIGGTTCSSFLLYAECLLFHLLIRLWNTAGLLQRPYYILLYSVMRKLVVLHMSSSAIGTWGYADSKLKKVLDLIHQSWEVGENLSWSFNSTICSLHTDVVEQIFLDYIYPCKCQ